MLADIGQRTKARGRALTIAARAGRPTAIAAAGARRGAAAAAPPGVRVTPVSSYDDSTVVHKLKYSYVETSLGTKLTIVIASLVSN